MADQLRLEMLDDRIKFRPGETIEGIAAWELERSSQPCRIWPQSRDLVTKSPPG